MHFGRLLRAAGLPVPSDRITLALDALQVAGLDSRDDFHDALMACLLDRREHRELFDQAFELFWRLPDLPRRDATLPFAHAPGPGRHAHVDVRATLRALARHGGDAWQLRWRRPRTRPAPLVVLADISCSMGRYSRMLLHFTHALGHADARVESFVFGKWLARTTHALRQRDPDLVIARVVREVQDWSGGTRISACLHDLAPVLARVSRPCRPARQAGETCPSAALQ